MKVIPKRPIKKTHKQMAAELGVAPVHLRYKIKEMRREGIPICSSKTDGYWLARNSKDVANVRKYLTGYINSMQKTNLALKKTELEMQQKELQEKGLLND